MITSSPIVMKKRSKHGYSVVIAVFLTLSLAVLSAGQIPPQISAQILSNTSIASPLGANVSNTPSPAAAQLVQRIEEIPSLSNIIGMSMVDGIKVSGLQIGDTDLTVTLRRQTAGSNLTENSGNASSTPVTIIATKLPVANITQLLTTAQSTLQLAATNSAQGAAAPLFAGQEANPQAGSAAVQILSLVRNLQMGTASIVNSNWTTPQTVSMGLLGMGNAQAPLAASEVVLVMVVPFQGTTAAPTLPLR
jgi:hypothetical protein